MKRNSITGLLIILGLLTTLAACGGGGGGGAPVPATKAILTLSTSGTGTISGIEATIHLPAGVSVKASPYSAGSPTYVTDPGVVVSSLTGTDVSVLASYVTTTSSSQININVINLSGFGAGRFATVNCDINSGSPGATSFSLSNFKAVDGDGAELGTITGVFTAVFQ